MRLAPRVLLWASITFIVAAGCSRRSVYENALKAGRQRIRVVADFNTIFPQAENWISYFDNPRSAPVWNCRTGMYGRYIFEMQVEVTFDHSGQRVLSVGNPSFVLREVREVRHTSDGRPIIAYVAGSESKIDRCQWEALVRSGGDFQMIGRSLKHREPVPGFAEAMKDQ